MQRFEFDINELIFIMIMEKEFYFIFLEYDINIQT